MCTEGSGVHLGQRNWNKKRFPLKKIGINENTFYLCNVRTFVFDYPGRIPRGVRLYRYCPIYREPSFNDCSLFLFVLHHEVLKIRLAKRKDHGDRCEVNPESWTQLKGSNEKGI